MAGRKLIAVAVASVALAAPPSAAAKSKVYAGTTDGGGQIAVDVKLNKDGAPKKITEIRVNRIPVHCDQSGDITVYSTFAGSNIGIKENGKFYGETVQETYGNKTWIRGQFSGKKNAAGKFLFYEHFLADEQYPEENCKSDILTYSVKRNAPDVVPGSPRRL
jgi:hypothetical protein